MTIKNDQILPYEYLTGKDFTENLKHITGCSTLLEMASLLDMPKTTFSTWNLHDRTSFELIVRLAMAKGIPVAALALSNDERKKHKLSIDDYAFQIQSNSKHDNYQIAESSPYSKVAVIKSYSLNNGKLKEIDEVPYSTRRLKGFGLESTNLIEVETNHQVYLIDENAKDAVSGDYLIKIDGRHSINTIQRLPKKLAIVFGNTKAEVAEKDIQVIGKVVLTLQA